MQYSPQGYSQLPSGVKNLLIINVLFYLATVVVRNSLGYDLDEYLALYSVQSSHFGVWQYLTYQFMHGSFAHIFLNMFSLWMFGTVLENYWGTKRFLLYYLICGAGAGLTHTLVNGIGIQIAQNAVNLYAQDPNPDNFIQLCQHSFRGSFNPQVLSEVVSQWKGGMDYSQSSIAMAQSLVDAKAAIPTVGASGAVYALLLAFGMMFPNNKIYLYFLVPIKAKWFVIGYGLIELYNGIAGTSDGIAHFAHLGGMLFGIVLILYWKKKSFNRWN